MADRIKTYLFVATAAESLGLSTTQVMDLIDTGALAHAQVEGIVLIETTSLAGINALQKAAV